ncbi:SDR family oxidoreductase [Deltaproteobacteria bacterium TL4]
MWRKIFLTGFPGFLGTEVLELLLKQNELKNPQEKVQVTVLVQPEFKGKARSLINRFSSEWRQCVSMVTGDLTKNEFGLDAMSYHRLLKETTEIFHIAALYRLETEESLAKKVNVTGTENVLNFACAVKNLKVLNHVSSIVVSGKREGVIYEQDLEHDSGFNNFYESTKYEAEVLVRRYSSQIPIIIFRPAVIVGDSQTGKIVKYDGPYYLIRLFLKLSRLPGFLVPTFGDYGYTPFNMTPVDFIAKAMVHLGSDPAARGYTFHLVDKYPLTSHQLFCLIRTKILGSSFSLYLPKWLVDQVHNIPASVLKSVGLAKSGVFYLGQKAIYDCQNTEAFLKGSGISCPSVYEYMDTMIKFVKEHPEIPLSI